jgi:excisionase family DNA binding protein
MNAVADRYLTVEEIADRLHVLPDTVRRWLRDGDLAGIRLGRRTGWRVTETDLAAFLRARTNVPPSNGSGP